MTAQPRSIVDQLSVWNALVGLFGTPLSLSQKTTAALAMAAGDGDAPGRPRYRMQTLHGLVEVTVLDFPFAGATGVELELGAVPDLPPPLPEILFDGMSTVLRDALPERARQLIVAVEPGACEPGLLAGAERVEVQIDAGWKAPARLRLAASLPVFAALVQGIRGDAEIPLLPDVVSAKIPVTVHTLLRGPVLPVAVTGSLMPGDLLVMPPGPIGILAKAERLLVALSQRADGWFVEESVLTEETDLPPAEAMPQAAALDEIPITVSFVIDTRRMTLAEVQALRPGALLPFAPPPTRPGMPVQILANGRAIGSGNLVEIDGQGAVRIAQLFGQQAGQG